MCTDEDEALYNDSMTPLIQHIFAMKLLLYNKITGFANNSKLTALNNDVVLNDAKPSASFPDFASFFIFVPICLLLITVFNLWAHPSWKNSA